MAHRLAVACYTSREAPAPCRSAQPSCRLAFAVDRHVPALPDWRRQQPLKAHGRRRNGAWRSSSQPGVRRNTLPADITGLSPTAEQGAPSSSAAALTRQPQPGRIMAQLRNGANPAQPRPAPHRPSTTGQRSGKPCAAGHPPAAWRPGDPPAAGQDGTDRCARISARTRHRIEQPAALAPGFLAIDLAAGLPPTLAIRLATVSWALAWPGPGAPASRTNCWPGRQYVCFRRRPANGGSLLAPPSCTAVPSDARGD